MGAGPAAVVGIEERNAGWRDYQGIARGGGHRIEHLLRRLHRHASEPGPPWPEDPPPDPIPQPLKQASVRNWGWRERGQRPPRLIRVGCESTDGNDVVGVIIDDDDWLGRS